VPEWENCFEYEIPLPYCTKTNFDLFWTDSTSQQTKQGLVKFLQFHSNLFTV